MAEAEIKIRICDLEEVESFVRMFTDTLLRLEKHNLLGLLREDVQDWFKDLKKGVKEAVTNGLG